MTLSTTVNAVARGFVIFDDGVAALPAPYAKFEFFLFQNDDKVSYKMTINNAGTMTTKPAVSMTHENLGTVNLMWASKTGLSQITTATVTIKDGSTVPISVKVDPTTDILAIPISSQTKQILFWDISSIDLK
jgi:hypothetical protein